MRDVPHLQSAVADLCGMDRAPLLMSADSLNKELRDRIEGQLAGLSHQHVRTPHKEVRCINRLKYILVRESMHAHNPSSQCSLCKSLSCFPVIKMCPADFCQSADLRHQLVPDILVVAYIYVESNLLLADPGHERLDDALEDIALRTRAADGQQEANGLSVLLPLHPRRAVRLDVLNQLMIHVVPGVDQRILRHGGKDLLLLHAVQDPIALIRKMCLHRVNASLCQM